MVSVDSDALNRDTPSPMREKGKGRQHALKHAHPDVGRVDAETFWLIWRDGVNVGLLDSARLSNLFREVGEWILVMGQARDAAPERVVRCPHCGDSVVVDP